MRRELVRIRVSGWLDNASGLSSVRAAAVCAPEPPAAFAARPDASRCSSSGAASVRLAERSRSERLALASTTRAPATAAVPAGAASAAASLNATAAPSLGRGSSNALTAATHGTVGLLRSFVEGAVSAGRRLSLTGMVGHDVDRDGVASGLSFASPRVSANGDGAGAAAGARDPGAQALALQAQVLQLQAQVEQANAVTKEALSEKVAAEARARAVEAERDALAGRLCLPSAEALRGVSTAAAAPAA
eukprot:354865-Chlamydomonas_euryale.AAC.1